MGKLSEEIPVLEKIKDRMKIDEKFTNDQIRDFERKVSRTYSNRFLVDIIQEYHNIKIKLSQLCLQKDKEIKRVEMCAESHAQKYKEAKERIIEEFGTKSYEYNIFMGIK
tara:strand:- start:1571 stop:1900 length:330 start_codon:yes stop_codon:yes gene_type:complete